MPRRLLVGSPHYILGLFASASDERCHGEKIASRRSKNAKKRVLFVVARISRCSYITCGSREGSTNPCATRIDAKNGRRWLRERHDGAQCEVIPFRAIDVITY